MRVLIACEFSGIVRDAFRRRGHEAWSVDLLPSEVPGRWHFQKDALWIAQDEAYRWDLMIAHPPCTHLAVSGARWFKEKRFEQAYAIQFVRDLFDCPIPRIAIENPISVLSSHIRKPDQIIQPWMFGHPETKATCFWLKNLPPLAPTCNVRAEMEALPARERGRVHHASPGPERWKERSRTLIGIAEAMAEQWGREETLSLMDEVARTSGIGT
jgi:hypothetical protein